MDISYKEILQVLIDEGKEIKSSILNDKEMRAIPYLSYKFADNQKYETWKNKCIRFLGSYLTGDRAVDDFEQGLETGRYHNFPAMMDKLLAVLESCMHIPQKASKKSNNDQSTSIINISQTQTQEITINIFIEAIKDELTGSQLKEIQQLIDENKEKNNLKDKLIDKLKSFGSDVATNIIANILTNPAIWH